MQLEIRKSDPTILEDSLGNPVFKFVGLHLGDVEDFMKSIKAKDETLASFRREIQELKFLLRQA